MGSVALSLPDELNYRESPPENLKVPYNLTSASCVVRVRNLSGVRKRKYVEEAVSYRRGGERSIKTGPYKGIPDVSVDALRTKILMSNEDVNWYNEKVLPVDMRIQHDSRRPIIPYKDFKTGKLAPWIVVDPGAWDLYMGNWERMNSSDPKERIQEQMSLATRGLSKYCIAAEDYENQRTPEDAALVPDDNPSGFLQWMREPIAMMDAFVDNDRVRSDALIEV